jgi:hypothetical protein
MIWHRASFHAIEFSEFPSPLNCFRRGNSNGMSRKSYDSSRDCLNDLQSESSCDD